MNLRRWTTVLSGAALLVAGLVPAATAAPDPAYPTGTFDVEQGPIMIKGYAGGAGDPYAFSTIRVTSLSDDSTPADQLHLELQVSRNANWIWPREISQDSGGWSLWFEDSGDYVPTVTITDADGHATVMTLPTIHIVNDATAPIVRVALPAKAKRHSVHAWRTLHGSTRDPDSAIYSTYVQVMQRRAGRWYVYYPRTHQWIRGSRDEQATLAKYNFGFSVDTLSKSGGWKLPVRGLKKGLLVIRADAANDSGAPYGFAPIVRYQLRRA